MAEFDQDDIRRPGVGRDPGARGTFTPTMLTPVADPVSKALQGYGEDMRAVSKSAEGEAKNYLGAASNQRALAAQFFEIGKTFDSLRLEYQKPLDDQYERELEVAYSKRATEEALALTNSPESFKPDFPNVMDRRLKDVYKEISESMMDSGQYSPSPVAKRASEQRAANVRVAAMRNSVIQLDKNRFESVMSGHGRTQEAIQAQTASTGDVIGGLRESDKAAEVLRGRLPNYEFEKQRQNNQAAVTKAYLEGAKASGDPQRLLEAQAHVTRLTGLPGPGSTDQIKNIYTASLKAGVAPIEALAIFDIESGLNSKNFNRTPGATASGLVGFTDASWKAAGGEGRAMDAPEQEQIERGLEWIRKNNQALAKMDGEPSSPMKTYVMHKFGGNDGPKIIRQANPNASLAETVGEAEAAKILRFNPHLNSMNVGQIRDWADNEMGKRVNKFKEAGAIVAMDETPLPMSREVALQWQRDLISERDKAETAQRKIAIDDLNVRMVQGEHGRGPMPLLAEITALPKDQQPALLNRFYTAEAEALKKQKFAEMVKGSEVLYLDRTPENTKLVDGHFETTGGLVNAKGEINQTNIEQHLAKFRWAPTQLVNRLNTMLASDDPKMIAGAMSLADAIHEKYPNAFPPGKEKEVSEAIEYVRDSTRNALGGGNAEDWVGDAVRRWREKKNIDPFVAEERKKKNKEESGSIAREVVTPARMLSEFSEWTSWSPKGVVDQSSFIGAAQERFAENYTRHGDKDRALRETVQTMKIMYGTTTISEKNKKVVTFLPPSQHPVLQEYEKDGNKWEAKGGIDELIQQDFIEKSGGSYNGVKLKPGNFQLGIDRQTFNSFMNKRPTEYSVTVFDENGYPRFPQPGSPGYVLDPNKLIEKNRAIIKDKLDRGVALGSPVDDPRPSASPFSEGIIGQTGRVIPGVARAPDPEGDLNRRQEALDKSGLGGAFRDAQQKKIDTERGKLAQADYPDAPGLIEKGNVNLNNRPRVKDGDYTATIKSASFDQDGVEVLVPTVSDDGKLMSNDEAWDQYLTTGKHLGKFRNPEDADKYGKMLSKEQGRKIDANRAGLWTGGDDDIQYQRVSAGGPPLPRPDPRGSRATEEAAEETWPELRPADTSGPDGVPQATPKSVWQQVYSRFFGGDPKTTEYKAPPLPNFPTSEDVEFAKKAGFYDDMFEPFTKGKVANILDKAANAYSSSNRNKEVLSAKNAKLVKSSPELAEMYAKAVLVNNRIPLAGIGFDPNKINIDNKIGPLVTVAGLYSSDNDQMYVNAAFSSTIVHESIHRGLELLRKNPDERLKKALSDLPSEELVVRWLMSTQAGNPERGEGRDVSTRQAEQADYVFGKSIAKQKYIDALNVVTEYAQKRLSERFPRRTGN